jgi:hypothetical protein
MADVFISYSKAHAELTRALAKDLEAKGLTVWWDTEMVPGESFRQRIQEELKAARAVIVIWTPESIHSDYVLSEAERARIAGKLIQVRTDAVEPHDLPPPFDTSHVAMVDDRNAIYGGLARFGLLPGFKPDANQPLPIYGAGRSKAPGSEGRLPIAIAVLAAVGVLTAAYRASSPPAPSSPEAQIDGITKTVLSQLSSGVPDSSLFAADVRLGRRGLMSKVDAVAELRKVQADYRKITCRIEGRPEAVTVSGASRTSARTKIMSVCDLVDKAGATRTERIPLEVETVPDADGTLKVAGLWQPEKQLFWQPGR